jgi:integrase
MKRVQQDTPLSFEEVKDMVERAKPEIKELIAFLYLTGCRISEALRVKVEDVWLEGDDRACFRIPILKTGKGGKHVIKVSRNAPFLSLILEKWRHKKVNNQITEPLFFFSSNLNSARVMAWRKIKKLNPRVYPHLFRHTRLTRLAEKGATASQLQAWAGWESIKMADIYVRRTARMIEDLADKVD